MNNASYVELTYLQVGLAALLIVVNGAISLTLRLGMERTLAIASVRTVVQLVLIGLVLELPPEQRLEGTAASVAIGIAKGADIIRVHDIKEMIRVCRMSDAIIRSRGS